MKISFDEFTKYGSKYYYFPDSDEILILKKKFKKKIKIAVLVDILSYR